MTISSPPENDLLLTASQTAEFLQLSVGGIYHMVSAKKLPVIKLSARCIRFSRRALLEWLDSLNQVPEPSVTSLRSPRRPSLENKS